MKHQRKVAQQKQKEQAMTLKSFRYTKKKDGETKNYLVLILDEDEKHIGGIDLSKLDDDEIKEVVEIQKEIEQQYIRWQKEAEEADIELEALLEDSEASARKEELSSKFEPFVKKAYRKFLVENISQFFGELPAS